MFPYERIIVIDRSANIPVYRQIAVSIINAIGSGTLKAGARLPSGRELAKMLSVHRKTAIAAYAELEAQDWITAVPRKYVAVSERIPRLGPQKWNENHGTRAAYREGGRPASPSADAEPITVPERIIDDGHPDVRLSPIDELLKTYRAHASRRHGIREAHIGTDRGTPKLREETARYLSETRGLDVSADNILIAHGAQMCIYLASRMLLGASSAIVVGRPNYPLANRTFAETGARLLEIDVDDNGMDTKALAAICRKQRITAVYVVPHHHYPTTVTLAAERRMELLELSRRHGFAIIEDDYDYDFHYSAPPYLPLASANHHGNVVYIGSFSKLLDPSLRIGFMAAPRDFIGRCAAFRRMVDGGGDGYMQNALASLIREGELKRHLKKARKIYHGRRDFLHALLQEKLSGCVSYTLPTGGMAIWLQLRPDIPIAGLSASPKLKIARLDGERNAFRFGFAAMDEGELEQTVDVLKIALVTHGGMTFPHPLQRPFPCRF